MLTKPRAKKRDRNHVGMLTRSLAWEWIKFTHPRIAEKIKAVAYKECGMKLPKSPGADPYMKGLLEKVSNAREGGK